MLGKGLSSSPSNRGVGGLAHVQRRAPGIHGVWGHFAGGGENPTDVDVIDGVVKEPLGD
jgi:hypothetical protein